MNNNTRSEKKYLARTFKLKKNLKSLQHFLIACVEACRMVVLEVIVTGRIGLQRCPVRPWG